MFFQKIFKNKKATSVLATIFLISILFLTLFLISQSAEAACMVDGDECSSPGSNSECCSLYCLSTHVCDSTDVGYYGGSYNSCINLYASGSTAVVCDDIVASGAFSADGICMPNGNCDTNEACFDGSAFRADCQYCTNAGAHQCDYDVAGSGWEPDGVCVESNNCGTGAVCVSGGYYYESLSSCANKSSCDKDVNSGGFSSDGIICSSSCVGSASSNCCSTSDCGVNQVCTNYTCVSSCTCSSGDCCDGCNYRLNSYQPAGTCRECTGSSATSILQASNEDRWGQCTTGSPGSATSCQSPNCSGGSAACGYLTAGTTCRAGADDCDPSETCPGDSAACPTDFYYSSGQHGSCYNCKQCYNGTCTNISSNTDPYTDCSSCQICSGTGYCTYATSGTDPKNNCTATSCASGNCNGSGSCSFYSSSTVCGYSSYNGCIGSCLKKRDIYKCPGDSANCLSSDQGDDTIPVSNGKICSGGGEISISASNWCTTVNNCSTGACSGTKYYVGCNGESCDTGLLYSPIPLTITADPLSSLTSSCISDSILCSATDHCIGDTYYTGKYCDGSGNCSVDYGNIGCCSDSYCSSDTYSSDSDGGQVYGTAGTCSVGTNYYCSSYSCYSSGGSGGGTDSCSGDVLTEYYTSGSYNCASMNYTCSNQDTCIGITGQDNFRDYYCTSGACAYSEYDRDLSQTYCEKSSGSCVAKTWIDPVCCGNDNNENVVSRVCDNTYACTASSSDKGCCSSTSYCVHNATCYATGSVNHDVNGDGDYEYCNAGVWYDCSNDSQCEADEYCSSNDCLDRQCISGDCCDGFFWKTQGTLCRADAGACDVADYCSGSSADCPDNKEPNATDCGDCWYCQSGSCVKVNSAAYDGGDDPNGDCGVTGCYTGDCGVNTGACAYYQSGQRACASCKECNSSGVCTNIAAGTDPYTNCSTCKYCDGSGNCINVIDTLTPENLDPKGNCNPTGCYTGDCKNDMGYCAYYTTGQQNCASCKECNSSGVCVSVTNSTDPYTDCGTCRYCQNGACENVSVSYTPANLDPLNNCGTNGCFTGDCLSSAGYCAYYGDNLQHNCLYGSICVSGECTVISSAEIKANETRMYAKTLDLNITESMVVGTIMPYAKNQVQVLGSETGSVIISGDLTLGPNAYLIFGDKVEIQPGGHLTLSGGAIVRAGSEIVSGPFGSDNPENAGVGRRACICVNDTSTYNTSYAAGAYGFLPEITGEDLCVPVSDANCGVNPRDGTLAANTIRAFDSEFWLWNSAKIDWNGNLFAWNPDIWYNDTHTATDPVCDVNYVDHYRYKLLSTASIDCDPYYWHTSFCTEDYNWSAGYWCMLPKKPGYSATFEEWTKP